MIRKKRYKLSSDAMEAAEIKNRAEECRKNAMAKIELRHHRNKLHGAEILKTETEEHLDRIHDVCPVTYAELRAYHKNQYKKHYNVYVHIVNCYMARQEENKEAWRRMRVTKEQPKSSFAREQVNTKERLELCKNYLEDMPVKSEDHIEYIARAFPEFFDLEDPDLTLERDWAGDLLGKMNIYSGARASHDRKCLSTRVRPVGQYPMRNLLNFKNFKPPPDWPGSDPEEPVAEQRKTALPPITNPKTFINVSPMAMTKGGFSTLHKKNKMLKGKVRRGSMMGQTGTSVVRKLNFKLPKVKL